MQNTLNAQPSLISGNPHHNITQEKVVGIIGGVSWESSIAYIAKMKEYIEKKLGVPRSAKFLLYSIEFNDFSEEERLGGEGDWTSLNRTIIDAAQRLKNGGADFIVIASNTVNSRSDLIEKEVGIPVLRIMDTTGKNVQKSGITNVILLGTKYTMEEPFYRDRLEQRYGLKVIVPNQTERDYINTVIFDELCKGIITNQSREGFISIINRLVDEEEAEGVILGCTEIPLLILSSDVNIPMFNSMDLHVEGMVDYAFNPMDSAVNGSSVPVSDNMKHKISGESAPVISVLSNNTTPMKVIGVIGGSSWQSSWEYYEWLNDLVMQKLGGLHSAKVLIYSFDFDPFANQERLGDAGNWTYINGTIIDAAQQLKNGGVDMVLFSDYTMNILAGMVEKEVGIPVLDNINITAKKVNESGISKVALVGTKYAMENSFYREPFEAKYGLKVVVPNETERDYLNMVIFDQLNKGYIYPDTQKELIRIINRLVIEEGAEGVILGCTELTGWINQTEIKVPIFDPVYIHSEAAVEYAINQT